MPLTNEERASLEGTVRYFEAQRQQAQQQISDLQARVRDFNTSIATVNKSLDADTSTPSKLPLATSRPPNSKYANMSVRWAILDLLNDSEPMTTAEIAEALKAEGVQTRAANFANNVSAVLSTSMKEQHSDVRQLHDGKWELTESGRSAIEHIRTTPKFRAAVSGGRSYARF